MIKAVLFDFGGVLTPGGGSGSIAQLFADIFGLKVADVNIDDLHHQLRRGEISTEDFFAEVNRRHPTGTPATPESFLAHADIFVRSEPVYQLAEQLRQHGIKTGMLSNMYELTAQALQDRGFYDGFEPLVLSCNEHLSKPDLEFYYIAVNRLGVGPQEILFIDDQEKCMPPAKALGMRTVLAKNAKQIVREAKAILKHENGLEL
jgi:putative hydrolase of the HAD superfamily